MAAPSVTYTFSNSTAADATEVNQNFDDIINGITDGTKDLTISGFTANGAASFNGNVTLGNATGDDITLTGRIASDLDPKTAASQTIGDATQTWQALYLDNTTNDGGAIYFDGGSTEFLKSTADGSDLQLGGFSSLDLTAGISIKTFGRYLEAKSANYTITDSDGVSIVAMTTGGTDRTVTLPTASANTARVITIKKVDSGTGSCTVDGEGSETIDGSTTNVLRYQYDSITIICDGTTWHVIDQTKLCTSQVRLDTGNGHGSTDTAVRRFTNATTVGTGITHATSAANGDTLTINEPGLYTITYTDRVTLSSGQHGISINASNLTGVSGRINNLAASERLISTYTLTTANNCSGSIRLAAGDVVRAQTDTFGNESTGAEVQLCIAQVERY